MMFNIEKVLGITKQSLKRKIHVQYDSDEASAAEVLLSRRGKLYTLAEIKHLHGFMLSGHDACVIDNSEDYSAVEVHTAQENERRHIDAENNIEKLEELHGEQT